MTLKSAPTAGQVRILVRDLWSWVRSLGQHGGVVTGIVDIEAGGRFHVELGAVQCDAIHWVALADACLAQAAARLVDPASRDLRMTVERARAELDFEDRAGRRQ